MRTKNSPIALEGLPFIGVAGGLALICIYLCWLLPAILFVVVALFCAFFFRNPCRVTPTLPDAVIAPADGVVILIGKSFEEHLQQETMKISIFMSVFNVHVNRAPVSGKVVDSFHVAGKFLDVRDDRATFENERLGVIIETVRNTKIVCVQVAGLIARRIVSYLCAGDIITMGEIYGLIRFGSRLDLYLPLNTDVKVVLGEKTTAGTTVLGILP